jgi:multidrug efflux pump subunit AcrA (membrane-fusion protein)
MSPEDVTAISKPTIEFGPGRIDNIDPRQKALAVGMEFTKRCFEAHSLDDIYLLLTNDLRALLDFDRAILIIHLGGKSSFVAAGNQPTPEKKSKFYTQANDLGHAIKGLSKPVLLDSKSAFPEGDVPDAAKHALQAYMENCGTAHLFCGALVHSGMTIGHLLLEFLEERVPDQIGILTLLNALPLISAAIAHKWVLTRKPGLASLLGPDAGSSTDGKYMRKLEIGFGVAMVLTILLFLIPIPVHVGGEAEIVSTVRHLAFAKVDGLAAKIFVAEGDRVESGQLLAKLDPEELEYKMAIQKKQVEILSSERNLLRNAATEDPTKLAESDLVELKRKAAWEELRFLKWQQQFLEIKAPVSGMVLGKDIESLSGKKFKAGEPFCELNVTNDLSAEVFVADDKIALVKKGQTVVVYLSGQPMSGHNLKIAEIAPVAEAIPRLGNVYRVRAPFNDNSQATMIGMKGIGRIYTGRGTIWSIVRNRLLSQFQKWAIHF